MIETSTNSSFQISQTLENGMESLRFMMLNFSILDRCSVEDWDGGERRSVGNWKYEEGAASRGLTFVEFYCLVSSWVRAEGGGGATSEKELSLSRDPSASLHLFDVPVPASS